MRIPDDPAHLPGAALQHTKTSVTDTLHIVVPRITVLLLIVYSIVLGIDDDHYHIPLPLQHTIVMHYYDTGIDDVVVTLRYLLLMLPLHW